MSFRKNVLQSHFVRALMALSLFQFSIGAPMAGGAGKNPAPGDSNTVSPIKHVIVIVGENRSFDHLFATYVPQTGTVNNLLSEGIIDSKGKPGANLSKAMQFSADITGTTTFQLSPPIAKKAGYVMLPAPLAGGPSDSRVTAGARAALRRLGKTDKEP